MIWFPFVLIGVVLAGSAIVYTIYRLSKASIKQTLVSQAQTNELSIKIKSAYMSGDYKVVNVGLRDKYGNEQRTITIQSEQDENDYYQGQILDL